MHLRSVPPHLAARRPGETERAALRRVTHTLYPIPLPPGVPLDEAIDAAHQEVTERIARLTHPHETVVRHAVLIALQRWCDAEAQREQSG